MPFRRVQNPSLVSVAPTELLFMIYKYGYRNISLSPFVVKCQFLFLEEKKDIVSLSRYSSL